MLLACKHVWERIHDYLDGTLDGAQLASVQRHLEHCGLCSAIPDFSRNIVILTADERIFPLPPGFSERLHARLERELYRMGP